MNFLIEGHMQRVAITAAVCDEAKLTEHTT